MSYDDAAPEYEPFPPYDDDGAGGGGITGRDLNPEGGPLLLEDQEDTDGYEAYGLKSRRREKKRFAEKPAERSQCFLCAYVGERNTVQVAEEVNVIVEMLRTNIGRMETATLAEQVATYYARYRARVNAHLQPGELPLPLMTERTVLEHIRKHNQDPEVKKLVILEELQEVREALIDVVLERSKRSKRIRGDKTQIDCLEKIIKLEWQVQAKDPSKAPQYSAGARVASGAGEAGSVVSTHGKTLYDFWAPRK
jgi:hypothetical protein